MANDSNVSAFISIHHNSDNDSTIQYTVTLWSTFPTVKGDTLQTPRDTTSLLAKKLGLRIRDVFHIPLNGPWDEWNNFTVLSRTKMASSITEASFISVPSETDSFYYNIEHHIEKEASAIFQALNSFFNWRSRSSIYRLRISC